ncbi:hypothetical protein WJX74_001453 [Apatococcus lobatus]|uniref:Uncharacterized protein n=1 Tax=Apatococcus lobatus TaxID=904363 RepID=A0AAW1QD24_9CHLO
MEVSLKLTTESNQLLQVQQQLSLVDGQLKDTISQLQGQLTQQGKELASLRSQLQLSRTHTASLLKMKKHEMLDLEFLDHRIEDLERYVYAAPSEVDHAPLQDGVDGDALLGPDIFTIREEGGSDDDDLHGAEAGSEQPESNSTGSNTNACHPLAGHGCLGGAENAPPCPPSDTVKANWGQQKNHHYRQTIKRLLRSMVDRQLHPGAVKAPDPVQSQATETQNI